MLETMEWEAVGRARLEVAFQAAVPTRLTLLERQVSRLLSVVDDAEVVVACLLLVLIISQSCFKLKVVVDLAGRDRCSNKELT